MANSLPAVDHQRQPTTSAVRGGASLAIGALADGSVRFGALQRRLKGVSPKALTATLRRLEEFGLVDREVVPAVPLHVEYSLTATGRSALVPVLALREWAESRYEFVRAHAERAATTS